MKKLLLSLVAALMILSGCNKAKQFKVTVNLENSDGQTAYLIKSLDGKKPIPVDTAEFVGNKAVLTADIDNPQALYILKVKGARFPYMLFPENQDVTVTGDFNDFVHVEATGGDTQNAFNEYQKAIVKINEPGYAIEKEINEAFEANDSLKYEELNAQFLVIWHENFDFKKDYVRNHADNYVGHYVLDDMKYDIEFDEVKELAELLTNESAYRDNVVKYIENTERVEIGAQFIDFTLKTADGKDVNLAEVIKNNKVTLVDFWASWCGPCRNENPFVKEAYEKYHAMGLEIVGISVDRNEAAWLQAVEEDALPYIQVRDAEGVAGDDYAVVYIPSNFLYDQNGVMIAKGLRGEELEAKLAEVLN
jgi:Peroxiredoxin